MASYELYLIEDVAKAETRMRLEAAIRVVYVVEGRLGISSEDGETHVEANQTWHGTGGCEMVGEADRARVWRWELSSPEDGVILSEGGDDPASRLVLSEVIVLDPEQAYLIRCDRVEFPPGGIAYRHTHQGPGIRCLLRGGFRVETGGAEIEIAPGEAWFERGPDPVYAYATDDVSAGFIRVMILPAALKGKSSIRYVNPEDLDKPKSQQYTVSVDEFIEI